MKSNGKIVRQELKEVFYAMDEEFGMQFMNLSDDEKEKAANDFASNMLARFNRAYTRVIEGVDREQAFLEEMTSLYEKQRS